MGEGSQLGRAKGRECGYPGGSLVRNRAGAEPWKPLPHPHQPDLEEWGQLGSSSSAGGLFPRAPSPLILPVPLPRTRVGFPLPCRNPRLREKRRPEAGKLPTSHHGCFVQFGEQAVRPCKPASVSTAAAAGPSRFPSPSFREARQARGARERPRCWGRRAGSFQLAPFHLDPARDPSSGWSVRLRRLPLAGLSVTGSGAGPEAGASPAPARNPAPARGPPQLHRHDTDTQSLQLLSESGALGTRRRRGQPGARTPAPAPAGLRAAAPSWPGAGGGDRAPAPASGAGLPAAAAAAAQLRAPRAPGSRRISEAAPAEAGERSRRRGRPPWLPAPTGPRSVRRASALVTFPGRLPWPRAPGPAPQAGARPSPVPPSRGAAGGRRRPGGRARRGRLQPPPLPAPLRSAPGPAGLLLPRRRAGARAPEAGGAAALASPGRSRAGPALKGRIGWERGRWSRPRRPLPGPSPRRTQAPAHAGRLRLGRVPRARSSSKQRPRRKKKKGQCSAWTTRTLAAAFGAGGSPELCAWHCRSEEDSACRDPDPDALSLVGGGATRFIRVFLCLASVTAKKVL
ncbi:collagen alpha-1(I) chain-like [Sapajus apella]|uniref:Collagen alpha-1(I) chain-like n=1 Tax=Sapajus apella TaxID=9515 RepID=A0A6J3GX37_SAPAP|nr:collagen alpha-1(I) chain-like [Sapajus apella]